MKVKIRGFSLIELMLAIAIVGILLAVAMPSYQKYRQATNRVEAQSYLMDLSNRAASYRLVNQEFTGLTLAKLGSSKIPNTSKPNYNVHIENVTNASGRVTALIFVATPDASSIQKGNGVLTITSRGIKCWYKDQDSVNVKPTQDEEGNDVPATPCTHQWSDK